ncbi:hypothetical protein TREES_T100003784 [Tupaia chinensis]|uniref:Uncharacterized protein n=1 Tax=Tupaia chinensis TaxID=246437 RepID=L9L7K0_TUPCH|nr:hypothetical protein TREES_T100003784 [Tupaia chinensis]
MPPPGVPGGNAGRGGGAQAAPQRPARRPGPPPAGRPGAVTPPGGAAARLALAQRERFSPVRGGGAGRLRFISRRHPQAPGRRNESPRAQGHVRRTWTLRAPVT